jgi:hypothetical protein
MFMRSPFLTGSAPAQLPGFRRKLRVAAAARYKPAAKTSKNFQIVSSQV